MVQVVDTAGVSGSVAAQMIIKDTTSIMAPVVGGLHRLIVLLEIILRYALHSNIRILSRIYHSNN